MKPIVLTARVAGPQEFAPVRGRGLKRDWFADVLEAHKVRPRTGARIETVRSERNMFRFGKFAPVRGRGLKRWTHPRP